MGWWVGVWVGGWMQKPSSGWLTAIKKIHSKEYQDETRTVQTGFKIAVSISYKLFCIANKI